MMEAISTSILFARRHSNGYSDFCTSEKTRGAALHVAFNRVRLNESHKQSQKSVTATFTRLKRRAARQWIE